MTQIKLQALWIYYKSICPFTLLVSFGLFYTYHQFHDGKALFISFKLFTLVLTAVMLKFYHRVDEFAFYENLGLKQTRLILLMLGFDFAVFTITLKLLDLL